MAKKKKQQRAGPNPVPSQNSIDSINDTIVTQPKPQEKISVSNNGSVNIPGSSVSVISSATSGSSVSSFASQQPVTSSSDQESPKYEAYRPPPGLQERVNPFDKNKPPSYDPPKATGTTSFYSSSNPGSSYSSPIKTSSYTPKPIDVTPPVVSSTLSSSSVTTSSGIISSGFDYSYTPSPIPVYKSEKSVEKVESPKTVTSTDSGPIRGKLERKLSDADIIFGSKPTEPYMSTYSSSSYSRNRSNSSFASTSTDSDYNSSRGDLFKRENPFQKSLSVSSDKDGDFASDSRVRAYQGIANDAFKDSFDSPGASTYTSKPSWRNNDDDYDLK